MEFHRRYINMASNINPLYPVEGNPTTLSVRNNFSTAKTEIESLQSGLTSHNHSGVYQPYDADIPTVLATQAEMEAGTLTTVRSMTPTNVKQAISALAGDFTYVLQSTSVTATNKTAYLVTTMSGPITITLPASPPVGSKVKIIDNEAYAATNNITVAGNSQLIMGTTDPLIVDVANANFILVFIGGAKGWVVG